MFEDEEPDEFEAIRSTPIYLKGMEICTLALEIADVIESSLEKQSSEDSQMFGSGMVNMLRENAFIIPAKIAGAHVPLYDLKMENAALIRKAARELQATTSGIRMIMPDTDTDYLQLLRDHIEEFRVIFAEWVKTFDPFEYIIDRWGLFNPPGVNYDDPDPDRDILFDKD
ncbi:MAG TPA: hypothetical protein DIW47_06655 [Bacteroidetes bacterium]|nr:hypothetical protein [Bacteroidota bacterium]